MRNLDAVGDARSLPRILLSRDIVCSGLAICVFRGPEALNAT